jgi:hypothetical protein
MCERCLLKLSLKRQRKDLINQIRVRRGVVKQGGVGRLGNKIFFILFSIFQDPNGSKCDQIYFLSLREIEEPNKIIEGSSERKGFLKKAVME